MGTSASAEKPSTGFALMDLFLVAICAFIFTLGVKEACKKKKGKATETKS
jgi:hypothetical protein